MKRGQKVTLDRDLAALYGETTFNRNKAVKRNLQRFPADFMFQFTLVEAEALVFQSGISKGGGGPPGEVSNQQLNDTVNNAIAGTARNPSAGIGPFTGDFSDPPTQWEMRAFRDWANSFFGATAR